MRTHRGYSEYSQRHEQVKQQMLELTRSEAGVRPQAEVRKR
jgi:hypothetical protein